MRRRLERHIRCLRSALAQPTRSTLPSSNKHEQLRGHRDAKVVVAARKVVEINTERNRVGAAARRRRGEVGWSVTQDACDQHYGN